MESSRNELRIGTWQGPIVDNGFEANLAKVRSVIEEAKALNLDFLCFPEAYLSGYSKEAVEQSSVPIDDPRITALIADTADQDTVYLVGMSERRADGIYNVQIVFYRGELLGVSPKTMLTGYDDKIYAYDDAMPVYTVKGVTFGVAICHTTSFIEPSLYLNLKGARLLFTPHYNSIAPHVTQEIAGVRYNFWNHRNVVLNNQAALATMLKMVVVRSNVVVIGKEKLGCGDSCIWDMNGNMIASCEPFSEGFAVASFPPERLTERHYIDRARVPLWLYERILDAAREKFEGGKM